MDAKSAEDFWNALAETDPLWAILSDPTRRGGRWDLETFFRTGEREISTLIYQLDRLLGPGHVHRRTALDFGCGVGRLTQALASSCQTVIGVDISSRMLEHARRLNRHGDRVEYVHNTSDDLRVLDRYAFDLIYSDLVLHHMPPQQSSRYIEEFVRLLAPGGILVFQLPSHPRVAPPPRVQPMTAHAYRAQLDLIDPPARWTPGVAQPLTVKVVNDSPASWDQGEVGALRLGNHWLSASGAMLVQDDGRANLPHVMPPGSGAVVTLDVTLPSAGTHILELDLVHEGHSWFADKGSNALRVTVETTDGGEGDRLPDVPRETWDGAALVTSSIDAAAEVAFPMFAIPREDVLALITSRGAHTFFVEDDDRGGQEWAGFRYFVRK